MLYSQVSIKRAARLTTYIYVVKQAARLIETWEYPTGSAGPVLID